MTKEDRTIRVVITGMGVVSPNGIGKQAFCRAILDGKSGIKRITRYDMSQSPVKIAGEIPDFDESAWIDARERKHVSRIVPLCVAACSEALQDAGLDPASMSLEQKREIGIILGSGGGAQEYSEENYRLWHSGKVKQVSLFCIPSGTMGTSSSEVQMRFGFRGYSHVVTTGCTSSTDAIGYAMQHIQAGVQPMFLAGGVDSTITPGIIKGYTLLRALTTSWNDEPERASRPFSADRDGFVLAEGSWMFVLEEYDHARARGARIYAEIAGYASTCEAFHRVRLSESAEEPARAVAEALQEAQLAPGAIDYVNLHGTSTQLNDRVETKAIKMALGERARQIPMSALKSQIGHPQGACGAAGVSATLVAMEHDQIPPTINLDVPDPDCDLDYVPQAGRKARIQHAICNCVGFGSKNSALVLRRIL
ncbi:MAG TPA: beta-ketoacyl-[acyl-carrier-protein] synthase family protein [Terriglobales bacterium]|nr:beta-ketoacyl-[acyl-carrier-protein] synthase family protein [Terriglobales bacterium]